MNLDNASASSYVVAPAIPFQTVRVTSGEITVNAATVVKFLSGVRTIATYTFTQADGLCLINSGDDFMVSELGQSIRMETSPAVSVTGRLTLRSQNNTY
jgi:hypothetical protein